VILKKKLLRPEPAILGIFIYPDALQTALTALQEMARDFTVFAPSALESIPAVLKQKFTVSGKPIVPWIPFVIVGFEFLILFGVLLSFAGMLIHSRLPQRALPAYYDPRFSDDRFGLLIVCRQDEREKIAGLLKEAGAEEIHDIAG
jgi:hypothetical protein